MGWVAEAKPDHRWDLKVQQSLFALTETNAISEVISTASGYYVVKLLGRRPSQIKPLVSVLPGLQHKLQTENRRSMETQWMSQLRSSYKVQIFTNVLSTIPSPTVILSSERAPSQPPSLK